MQINNSPPWSLYMCKEQAEPQQSKPNCPSSSLQWVRWISHCPFCLLSCILAASFKRRLSGASNGMIQQPPSLKPPAYKLHSGEAGVWSEVDKSGLPDYPIQTWMSIHLRYMVWSYWMHRWGPCWHSTARKEGTFWFFWRLEFRGLGMRIPRLVHLFLPFPLLFLFSFFPAQGEEIGSFCL